MDSVKKQLRFFKVLITILVVMVMTQFVVLYNVWGGERSSDSDHLRRVRVLEHPGKVIEPAASVISFIMKGI